MGDAGPGCFSRRRAGGGADARGVLLVDLTATLNEAGACHLGNFPRCRRGPESRNGLVVNPAPPRDLTVTPRRPLGIIQQPQHRPALVRVRPTYAAPCGMAPSVEIESRD